MANITSFIEKELYKVTVQSPSGNAILVDEPEELGGKNLGFAPDELLISALAACTNITVRMYADRKAWPLEEVHTNIEMNFDKTANKTFIDREIELKGELSDDQIIRLQAVANACPIHKILNNPVEITTEFK